MSLLLLFTLVKTVLHGQDIIVIIMSSSQRVYWWIQSSARGQSFLLTEQVACTEFAVPCTFGVCQSQCQTSGGQNTVYCQVMYFKIILWLVFFQSEYSPIQFPPVRSVMVL